MKSKEKNRRKTHLNLDGRPSKKQLNNQFEKHDQYIFDSIQNDLNRQVAIASNLDTKSSILIALNIGALALTTSKSGISNYDIVNIAISVILVCALSASLWVIKPRPLKLYLRNKFLLDIKENPVAVTQKIFDQLIEFDMDNLNSINEKLKWSSWAVKLNMIGFAFIGIAYLIKSIIIHLP